MTVAVLLVLAGLAGAAPPPKSAKFASMAKAPVNPRALRILNQVCEVLSSAKAFSYHAEINFDSVLPSDVKLQFAAAMDVALQRPNRLAVAYASDLGGKRVWYNGKSVTVLDPARLTYATAAAPASIDEMLEKFAQRNNMSIPLEGFDFSHPCARIQGNLVHGAYVGVGDVDGVDCDHLAFMQKGADWQIWIDRAKPPLPRKVVITYTLLPMAPQYSAVLSKWNFDPKFPEGFFEPQIPKPALRIKFIDFKEKRK
jgi:hypothetical protein